MENNQIKQPGKRGGARPGGGRPKGSLDKGNALIRQLACQALEQAGGVEYLARVAETHPGPFLSLLGKILPTQVTGEGGGPLEAAVKLVVEGVRAGQGTDT